MSVPPVILEAGSPRDPHNRACAAPNTQGARCSDIWKYLSSTLSLHSYILIMITSYHHQGNSMYAFDV